MISLLFLCVLPAACLGGLVGLAGGLTDVTLTESDPNVLFALTSINGYYSQLGDTNQRQLVKIESAKSQVVAGSLMHLVLRVSAGGKEETCKVNVWSRPWLSGDAATQVTQDPECKPADPLAMVGGERPIDTQSADVQNALGFAVTSLNAQENYLFMRKPTNIARVTSQVVSGMSYHFYGVEMSTTDCTKSSTLVSLDSCSVTDGGNVRTCDFTVWYQSWMTPQYKLINLDCQ